MARPAQRADARRNRAAIMRAARDLFAVKGPALSTEEVARTAGVGIGTVFRHFPSKEKLLEALYHERLEQTAERARAAARAPDPGAAVFDFLTETVLDSGAKIALADALADAGIDVRAGAGPHGHDLTNALTELLTRAQQAGAVRADIGASELAAVLYGASRAAGFAVSKEIRSRTVRVILDGLRPPSHPTEKKKAAPAGARDPGQRVTK
jgi:Transcriptional regulator